MTTYSIVDEGYEVELYTSIKKLVEFLVSEDLYAVTGNGERLYSKEEIRYEIETSYTVRFYREDDRDWTYKVHRHA